MPALAAHERDHGVAGEVRQERAAAGEDVVAVEGAARVGRRQQPLAAALAARVGEDRLAAGQPRERAAGADHAAGRR